MLNVELDPVKCRTTIKALLLINLNLCLSVMLDNLLHSFTWTSLLTYSTCTWTNRCKLTRQYSTSMTVVAYFIKILVYASTNVCNKAIFVKFMQLYHTTPLAWSTRVDLILIVKLYTTSLRHMVQCASAYNRKQTFVSIIKHCPHFLTDCLSVFNSSSHLYWFVLYSTGKTTLGHNTLFVCLLIAPVAVKI